MHEEDGRPLEIPAMTTAQKNCSCPHVHPDSWRTHADGNLFGIEPVLAMLRLGLQEEVSDLGLA
jgi:hypothetical protein